MSPTLLPLLVALLAPPPPAEAVEPAAESPADDDIETIRITALRARREARDSALAVDTLRPEDDPRPLPDLGALLDRAPGLRVLRSGDPGRGQTVQLRGAGGHQVAVLLDGVPLSGIRGAAVDLGAIPPSMLEAADVVRGAAGAAYGSGAQGGALRLRTRRGHGALADVRLRGGSVGLFQGEGALSAGGAAGDGLLMLGGSRADGDFDYRDAQGRPATRLNNDHSRVNGLLRGRLRMGDVTATALAHGLHEARGEPGSDQFPDGDARTAREQLLAALSIEGDGLDARLVWRARGWWLQRRSTFSDPTGPALEVPARVRDRSVGLRASAEWHGFDDHRPVVALEGHHDHALAGTPAAEIGEDRLGGAAVLSWSYEGVDGLRVVPIVRVDGLEGRTPMVVPQLGLVWAALDAPIGLELRSNTGRLFRDPGFDELYVRGQGIRGDPELRPEDGWGADLGLTARLVGERPRIEFELELMAFAQRYDRIILFVPTDAYTVRARDDFSAAVDGVELALRLDWRGLRFEGTWTGQDARFTSDPAAPLPDRPSHRLVGLLSAELGPVIPFAAGRWHGAVSADRFGSRSRPGYGALDVGLSARLPFDLTTAVEVRNLLDARAFDLLQRPLPGRSVVIELGWSG